MADDTTNHIDAATPQRRRVVDVRPRSYAEFAGKPYIPYKGMPIFTTIHETDLHPVIGEDATSYYARVTAHPRTVVIVDSQPGTFAHGEERPNTQAK